MLSRLLWQGRCWKGLRMELRACFPTLMLPHVANPSQWAAGHLLISSFSNLFLQAGAYAGVWAHTDGLLSALSQVQHWAMGWEWEGELPAPHAQQEWAPGSPTQEHRSFPALLPPAGRAKIESPLLGRRVSHLSLPLGKLWLAQIYLATHGESRGRPNKKKKKKSTYTWSPTSRKWDGQSLRKSQCTLIWGKKYLFSFLCSPNWFHRLNFCGCNFWCVGFYIVVLPCLYSVLED